MFLPNSDLMNFVLFVQAFVQYRFNAASASMQLLMSAIDFGNRKDVPIKVTVQDSVALLVERTTVSFERMQLLRILFDCKFDETYVRLYSAIIQAGSIVSNVEICDSPESVIMLLLSARHYERARTIAQKLSLDVHHITLKEVEDMAEKFQSLSAREDQEQHVLWERSHALFEKYSCSPEVAALFFINAAVSSKHNRSTKDMFFLLSLAHTWILGQEPEEDSALLNELVSRLVLSPQSTTEIGRASCRERV